MLQKVLQQKELKITKPPRKISFIDPSDMNNTRINYENEKIPIALIGNITLKELECTLEGYDLFFNTQRIKEGDKTTIYEINICFAPNEDILKLYQDYKYFRGTITKETMLYTNDSSFNVSTLEKTINIKTNKKEYYYGHIYEYKKKNETTGKYGNLGYSFTFYINPALYTFAETICIIKELFQID